MYAAMNGRTETVAALLGGGADIDAKDDVSKHNSDVDVIFWRA